MSSEGIDSTVAKSITGLKTGEAIVVEKQLITRFSYQLDNENQLSEKKAHHLEIWLKGLKKLR